MLCLLWCEQCCPMIVPVVASVHYKWWPMKVLKRVHFYQSLVLLWGRAYCCYLFLLFSLFSFILCSLHSCSGTVVRWNHRSCNISRSLCGRNELSYLYDLPHGACEHQLWPHFLPQLSLWTLEALKRVPGLGPHLSPLSSSYAAKETMSQLATGQCCKRGPSSRVLYGNGMKDWCV